MFQSLAGSFQNELGQYLGAGVVAIVVGAILFWELVIVLSAVIATYHHDQPGRARHRSRR